MASVDRQGRSGFMDLLQTNILERLRSPLCLSTQALSNGFRNIRREASVKQQQIRRSFDRLFEQTREQLQCCLSDMRRLPSSASFAAISASDQAQPFHELAGLSKDHVRFLDDTDVFIITTKDNFIPITFIREEAGETDVSDGVVFVVEEHAEALRRNLGRKYPELNSKLVVTRFPLIHVYSELLVNRRQRKDSARKGYHFVPSSREIECALAIQKLKATKSDTEKCGFREVDQHVSPLYANDWSPLEENNILPQLTERRKTHTQETSNATLDQKQDNSEIDVVTADSDSAISGAFTGVPIFLCKSKFSWTADMEASNIGFLSYRDMEAFIRLGIATHGLNNLKQLIRDAESKKAEAIDLKKQASEASGRDEEQLLEKAKLAEDLYQQKQDGQIRVFEDILDDVEIDVTSLEVFLQDIGSRKKRSAIPSIVCAPNSVYQELEKNYLLMMNRRDAIKALQKKAKLKWIEFQLGLAD